MLNGVALLVASGFGLLALAADAAFCVASCAVFLAWLTCGRPMTIAGRAIGEETTHDPVWTLDDTRAHLDWQAEQDLLCPGCHLPRDETMRDDTDPHAPKYIAEAVVCNACAERGASARAAADDNDGRGMDGWMWTIGQRANGRS